MSEGFQRLDFGPGWRTTNDNLIELVDLFPADGLDWTPREGEWSAWIIYAHLIGARYHGPIPNPEDLAHLDEIMGNCRTGQGIKDELEISWTMLARFLSNPIRLDAIYDPGTSAAGSQPPAPPTMGSVERINAGLDIGYVDNPEEYTGHYIAYHRFAHDLHHRSTLVGYRQLGVTLDGHRIRPL